MLLQLFFYFLSFLVIWFGAGMIVNSVDRLSHKLNLSAFAVSFFVLGILTSVPEMSVGVNSIIDRNPEIFVGNLIGGIPVIFLLIIPLLAIFGNGVKLTHQIESRNLLTALLVIAVPTITTIDGNVSLVEGILSILFYAILVYIIEKRKGLFDRVKDTFLNKQNHALEDVLKILGGVVTIFLASKYVVDTTIYFSSFFNVSSYLISLIVISLGTNLPELSLVVRSLLMKKKEVALGDYMGSAAANTVIFGTLVILNRRPVIITNHLLQTTFFTVGGLALFYLFSKSKQDVSRREGIFLLLVYLIFVVVEIIKF